jgi:xylulokinase
MSEKYFMGIDIGTFESKGAIIDSDGNIIATHSCPHEMESPKPGYAEHDAEQTWWKDLYVISNAMIEESKINPDLIKGFGCSTIAPCCLPVDKDCNPLRKAILYGVDVRASEEINYLEDLYGADEIFNKCGTAVTSQSAAAKILWIKNNEPEVYAKAAKFVTGSTYLVAKLTDKYVIDNYTAATWVPIYDIPKADWVDEGLEIFCRRDQLAECKWTDEIVGHITEKASKTTGLSVGTPVVTGTADASAEALSVGVMDPGDMMLMYGSSIFIIHVVDKFTTDKRLWAGPYMFEGTYAVAAGMSTSGTLTRWFRDNFSKDIVKQQEETGENAYAIMAESIKDINPGSEGLIVLPYFSGERTPLNDPKAKGMIFGLNLSHTREHVYNACLEGVGYGIAQHFDIFDEKEMGTKKVMAVGGGVKNKKWLQTVSDISGKDQNVAEISWGAAYGDALLAALGVGHYKDTLDVAKNIKLKITLKPDSNNTNIYKPYKDKYDRLYKVTKDIMHEL